MLREHFHKYRERQRRIVLASGLFMLFGTVVGIATGFGMEPLGTFFIAIAIIVIGMMIDAVSVH